MRISSEHANQQTVRFSDFSGGLNTTDAPESIAENELSRSINVEIYNGQLKTVAGDRAVYKSSDISFNNIIYDAIEEVKSAMEGMLSPEIKEEITAYVEVQQVFKITKVGTVAGCMVKEGNKIRLIRDGIVIYAGELGSLKRFKDDAKEVVAGLDCGLNITNFNDIQVGDMIEAYEETEIKKTL